MVRFNLFGIPITVEPWFWVTMAFLGGAMNVSTTESLLLVILFMMAGFISVVGHELGHALTGYKWGGGRVWIQLWGFGGLAHQQGGRLDRKHRCGMILAGPGVGLLLAAISIILLFVLFPQQEALVRLNIYLKYPTIPHAYLVQFFPDDKPVYGFLNSMIWVNIWWSLLNLLPIYPLDGGQFMDQFIKSRKQMHKLSIITCVVVSLFFLKAGMMMGLLFFGFFIYQNYKGFKEARY